MPWALLSVSQPTSKNDINVKSRHKSRRFVDVDICANYFSRRGSHRRRRRDKITNGSAGPNSSSKNQLFEGCRHSSVPSILLPRVRVLSTSRLMSFIVKIVLYLSIHCEKNDNKHKEAGVGQYFFKKLFKDELFDHCQIVCGLLVRVQRTGVYSWNPNELASSNGNCIKTREMEYKEHASFRNIWSQVSLAHFITH